MDYQDALSYLNKYTNYERHRRYPYDGWSMNLERVGVMLSALGHPENRLRVVHIAGTKGKGSTAAMIESMARAAGWRTGLYTSPHLLDLRERVRLNGEPASAESVAALIPSLQEAAAEVEARPELGELTFFEILTVLAFLLFERAGVDLAVFEAGLGGRYDATTACRPLVSVLTPVSFDHMDILGPTIAAIATEKSFIIKPHTPAVIAPQVYPDAATVFHRRCQEVSAPEIQAADRYRWRRLSPGPDNQRISLTGGRQLENIELSLLGEHQVINALTAVTVLDVLGEKGLSVSDAAVRKGLKSIRWPARFERIQSRPDIILDGAHNAHSAAYLCRTLLEIYPERKRIAILGLGEDKDVEGFIRELAPGLHAAILTHAASSKAAALQRLRDAFAGQPVELFETESVAAAIETAQRLVQPDDVIVVTGSFYIISEVLEWRRRPAGAGGEEKGVG